MIAPRFLDIHRINSTHEHITGTIRFVAGPSKAASVSLATAEHHDIRWCSLADLETLAPSMTDAVKWYCQKAIEEITSSGDRADQISLWRHYYTVEGMNSFATVIYFNYLYFFFRDQFGFNDRQNLELAALIGLIYTFASWLAGRFAQRCMAICTALKLGFSRLWSPVWPPAW